MRERYRSVGRQRVFAAVGTLVCLAAAVSACAVAQTKTPSPAPVASGPGQAVRPTQAVQADSSPTAPIYCQDGPGAPTYMPADCVRPGMPSYGLVTARPSRGLTPAAPSSRPTASPTPADSLGEEGTGYFNETVAPGSSITVAVDFENSSFGFIAGYAKSGAVVVTFRGQPLTLQQAAGLGADVWAFGNGQQQSVPVNGDLVIKNPTASPVPVAGWVMITSRRHLAIDLSTNFPSKGQTFTLNLSLTEATASDEATVSIIDRAGASIPVPLTKTGIGTWTGSASLPSPGEYDVRASTSGSRMRVATGAITVGAGDVSVSRTFRERVDDTNRDGLIDQLVLTPTVTVATAGKYVVRGSIYDQAGVAVGFSGGDEKTLSAGAQPVDISFDGAHIYESGRWGPYTLHVTVLHEISDTTTIEVDDAALGQTAAYDYMQFEHQRISVDPKTLKSEAVDTNGDGHYEELRLTGTVVVESPGQYTVTAGLYVDNPWDEVASAAADSRLSAGANTFTISFAGSDIAKAGRDGPYQVPTLAIYPTADPTLDTSPIWSEIITAAYGASQFR